MGEVSLTNIFKRYPAAENYSVTDFNLQIEKGEFIVFVGPSGCGKSTTLRMIAGLEDITEGELKIGDRVMNEVAPKDRDIAMVFQNYALYPHMSVFDNMAFGLKLRKYDKADIKKRVENAAEILGLTEYLGRKPAALSGGQRQRVALGRAIVRDARVFLMDEPLSNLDAKLRVAMRAEIAKLHRRLDTTSIYVTHDQTEAMTMADRIVIMKDGVVQQIGTPMEVYNTPANVFVAGFIGSPAMNFFNVIFKDGRLVNTDGFSLAVPETSKAILQAKGYEGKSLIYGMRPENIHTSDNCNFEANEGNTLRAEIVVSELHGAETMLYTKVGSDEFISRLDAVDFHRPGENIDLVFSLDKGYFFDAETQEEILQTA